jgi:hypothetical protein
MAPKGATGQQAMKLVQFVPIAFTRFLYRAAGVRFAPSYVVLGPDGQPAAQRPVADQPAFREAWGHCEDAAADGAGDDYFVPIAARSGGYRALKDFVRQGLDLADVGNGPPEEVSIRIDDPTFLPRLLAEVPPIGDAEFLYFDTAMVCASTRLDPGEVVLHDVWGITLVRDGKQVWALDERRQAEPGAAADRGSR